jgi:hypothetical protein
MEHRVPTIFEVADEAARRQAKARPQTGQRKLKSVPKPSSRTARRRPAAPKRKQAGKRKR